MSEGYHPAGDDSPLFIEDDSTNHRAIINQCIWMIILDRFDIAYATSAMCSLIKFLEKDILE
jgi:hypothetical protein